MTNPDPQDLVAKGALFVCSHSGGKDSQAMLIHLLAQGIPATQIVAIHASLGDLEWPGAMEHARDQANAAGIPLIVATANFKDGSPKTLLNKAEHQYRRRPEVPSWPSSDARWCTGELKTGPIERETRRYAAEHGFKLIVMCVGIRAAEGDERAKKPVWEYSKLNSVAGRTWWKWHPIFRLSTREVFATIAAAGQQPHQAYANGNERLSCLFCIFGSRNDLRNAAKAHPDVLARYTALEARTGYTMHMSRHPLDVLISDATL